MPTARRLKNVLFTGSRTGPLAAGLFLIATVGWLDWITGPNLDFALFYLIPVCFVTWHAGSKLGHLTSIASAAVWLLVDRLTGAKPALPLLVYWNLLMRLAFFSASVLLLEGWKHAGLRLSSMVAQRTAALRRLAAQLSAAEDAERRTLAYDIHDALSQTLSLIKINLDEAVLASDRPAVQRRLANCGSMIDDVIKQTRTLMFDLYPAMLDDLGLVPTLEWYAKEFKQRTGAEVTVSEQGARTALPTTLTNYLFRAVKELLGNAVRHGRAKEIVVVAHWETDSIRLTIDDDGKGFDVNLVRSPDTHHGLGLAGIDERITSMGGHLLLESNAGYGSRIILDVPLPKDVQKDYSDAVASSIS